MVLSMEDAGFADVTGFICRRKTLDARRGDVNVIRMWFDCVNYVTADLQGHSATSLDYIQKTASTQYTFDEYRAALSQEFLPRTVEEASSAMYRPGGQFDFNRISSEIGDYVVTRKLTKSKPPVPVPLVQ